MRRDSGPVLPFWRRMLYLLLLAQLPFTTLIGLVLAAGGSLRLPGQSLAVTIGALILFFIGCVIAALPAWWLTRMARRPAWWKGALVPASTFLVTLLGVQSYNLRNATGMEAPLGVILSTSLLMLAVLGVPGAIIGGRMAAAQRRLEAEPTSEGEIGDRIA